MRSWLALLKCNLFSLFQKLRDKKVDQNLLSSYAIKTVFLWEMDVQTQTVDFWNKQLSFLFLHVGALLSTQCDLKYYVRVVLSS